MATFRVKCVETAGEWHGAVAVRLSVFVDEQRVPVDAELDRLDDTAVHVVALLDGGQDKDAALLAPARSGTAARAARLAAEHGVPPSVGDGDCEIAPVVGTARLVVEETSGRIGRVAVLPGCRGLGIGAALMTAVEREAATRGLVRLRLHAQTHAIPFYERLGYGQDAPSGVFDEDGIAHVRMSKSLPR